MKKKYLFPVIFLALVIGLLALGGGGKNTTASSEKARVDKTLTTKLSEKDGIDKSADEPISWAGLSDKVLRCGESQSESKYTYFGNQGVLYNQLGNMLAISRVEAVGADLKILNSRSGVSVKLAAGLQPKKADLAELPPEMRSQVLRALNEDVAKKERVSFDGVDYLVDRVLDGKLVLTELSIIQKRGDKVKIKMSIVDDKKPVIGEVVCEVEKNFATSNSKSGLVKEGLTNETCYSYITSNLLDPRLRADPDQLSLVREDCKRPRVAVCVRQKISDARKQMADDDPISPGTVAEWEQECAE